MSVGELKTLLAAVGGGITEIDLTNILSQLDAFANKVKTVTLGAYNGFLQLAEGEATLARQAGELGLTSQRLQELGYVAEQGGSSFEVMVRSLEGLLAQQPGVSNVADALEQAGEQMRSMDATQRQAFATKMGIDPSLVAALTGNVTALKKEFQEMYAGAEKDGEAAGAAANGFLAEIEKLRTMAQLMASSVFTALLGQGQQGLAKLRALFTENMGPIRRVLGFVAEGLQAFGDIAGPVVLRVVQGVLGLVRWFDSLGSSQKNMVGGALALLAAWKLLNLGFVATPLGAVIAGLVALVGLVGDYLTFMEGGKSSFDWSPWADSIQSVLSALSPVMGIMEGIGNGIIACVEPVKGLFTDLLGSVLTQLQLLGKLFVQVFAGDFSGALQTFFALLANTVDAWLAVIENFCTLVGSFFTALWPSVEENFPDFSAWAERQLTVITSAFGRGFEWVLNKFKEIKSILPEFVNEALGITSNAGQPGAALQAASALETTALTPGAGYMMALGAHGQQNMNMTATTTIHMQTADPILAGNQVYERSREETEKNIRDLRGNVG
ncbi:hypothetical protein [Desulfovibrio cuneatus]|uniref:hypothetical protein n=1 Tax=Desulfovibrio cuneatus TaxID=159728 RepID=UPI0003FDC0B6|nr:hypothetical protein [Desulfovibrio cuneatus]